MSFGIAMLMAFSLGCDGDSSDPVVDVDPPEVDSTSPADGDVDVARDAAITITFDESMDDSTLTTSSISLSPAATGTVSYNDSTHTATFFSSVPLDASTTYTVTVSTDCEDAAGNNMFLPHTFDFTTAAASPAGWTRLGGQVSTAGSESEDPTMLIVNNTPAVGYRHASFQAHMHVWNGTDWGTTETDPSSANMNYTGYHAPSFASNGTNIFLTFSLAGVSGGTTPEFYDRVFAYRWTSGSGYSIMNSGDEVSFITTSPPGANAHEPHVSVTSTSNPFVTWIEDDTGDGIDEDHLWIAEVTNTGITRSTALSRNNSAGSYATNVLSVSVLAGATSYVAQWESHESNQYRTDLYVSSYTGGTFSALGGVVEDDYDYNNLSKPSLALFGGDLYIAYTKANSSDYTKHVYVKRWTGATWATVGGGPVTAYSASDHYDSADPDLIVANGKLYVAWDESDDFDGPFIYVAYYDTGTTSWVIDGDKLNVDQSNTAHDPSLAWNSTDGYLYVAFAEYTDGHPHIFVKRKDLTP